MFVTNDIVEDISSWIVITTIKIFLNPYLSIRVAQKMREDPFITLPSAPAVVNTLSLYLSWLSVLKAAAMYRP